MTFFLKKKKFIIEKEKHRMLFDSHCLDVTHSIERSLHHTRDCVAGEIARKTKKKKI